MYKTFKYCIDDRRIRKYYTSNDYNVITFRKFILENFKYKNGKEIMEDTGARESLLNAILVYKDEEKIDLKTKVMDLIDFMRQEYKDSGSLRWWHQTRQVLFIGDVYNLGWRNNDINKLVGKYELQNRFKTDLKEIIKTLIREKDETEDERYIIF